MFSFFFQTSFAQDKKVTILFNQKSYCKCIARCEKVLSKKGTAEVMYYKASALLQLYKNPDKDCEIKDPLKKSLRALERLKRYKNASTVEGIKELEDEIINIYVGLYNEAIKNKKWEQAVTYIDILLDHKPQCNYHIDKAYCEYALLKPDAINSISDAFQIKVVTQNKDTSDVFTKPYEILKDLDRSDRIKEYNQLMDTLIFYFPKNHLLLTDVYNNLLKKWYKYKRENKYDSLVEYSKYLAKYYPENIELKNQINNAFVFIADSLTGNFTSNNQDVMSLVTCCNFLSDARVTLGAYADKLRNAKYFQLKVSKYKFSIFSASKTEKGNTLNYDFSIESDTAHYVIRFNDIYPVVCLKIKGFIWEDTPRNKQAKDAKDIVKKESMNYHLLDSLTHVYCNKFRASQGVRSLKWNNTIYRGSKHHSGTLACYGGLFHGEPLDSTLAQIDSIKMYMKILWGENCQLSGFSNSTYDEMAKAIIEIWENSPGHRRNMLDQDYKYEAISTTIVSNPVAMFIIKDEYLLKKYYPEVKKLFEVFPYLKSGMLEHFSNHSYDIWFSSQNFWRE